MSNISKILVSPAKYIQGPGELSRIEHHLSRLKGPFLLVMGGYAYENLKGIIEESCKNSEIKLIFERFTGECTHNEIDRLRKIYALHGCRATVGIGGGKALDTAKGVAYYEGTPVITIPTIASTDSPTSAISVVYTEEHVFDENLVLPTNPELVLVDTDVITQSPVRLLVSGMGDALSTYFEARANDESDHENCVGGKPTNTSLALAGLCHEIIIRDGLSAKISAETEVCSRELENVIEANIYLSGVGFESNGLACAHSIYNSLTILPSCHHMYHGELVAFGTIVQLILEKRPESEIKKTIDFCISVGLPVTFSQVSKTELTADDIMKVAVTACSKGSFMESEPIPVTPQLVFDALMMADRLGTQHLSKVRQR